MMPNERRLNINRKITAIGTRRGKFAGWTRELGLDVEFTDGLAFGDRLELVRQVARRRDELPETVQALKDDRLESWLRCSPFCDRHLYPVETVWKA